MFILYLLVLLGLTTAPLNAAECALRFEDTYACACAPSQAVSCYRNTVIIQPCYCMYYDQHMNLTLVARCYYFCYRPGEVTLFATNSTEFNAEFCSQYGFHRVGRFCGQCNASYGLAAYAYQTLSCVPCQDYGYKNWLKYFAVALLPVTVFYILAVLLQLNVTSSSLNGVILIAQCITSPAQVEYFGTVSLTNVGLITSKIAITVFSIFKGAQYSNAQGNEIAHLFMSYWFFQEQSSFPEFYNYLEEPLV